MCCSSCWWGGFGVEKQASISQEGSVDGSVKLSPFGFTSDGVVGGSRSVSVPLRSLATLCTFQIFLWVCMFLTASFGKVEIRAVSEGAETQTAKAEKRTKKRVTIQAEPR